MPDPWAGAAVETSSHLAHGLDDELVIMREEEDAARLARGRQFPQSLITCKHAPAGLQVTIDLLQWRCSSITAWPDDLAVICT